MGLSKHTEQHNEKRYFFFFFTLHYRFSSYKILSRCSFTGPAVIAWMYFLLLCGSWRMLLKRCGLLRVVWNCLKACKLYGLWLELHIRELPFHRHTRALGQSPAHSPRALSNKVSREAYGNTRTKIKHNKTHRVHGVVQRAYCAVDYTFTRFFRSTTVRTNG